MFSDNLKHPPPHTQFTVKDLEAQNRGFFIFISEDSKVIALGWFFFKKKHWVETSLS